MTDETITIEVDGKSLAAKKGQMLIEVTDANDIYVPRFCYHNKLAVAANCRMCLVEVEKAPKPLPACATPVADGMVVKTRSGLALEAQKSVMEFLLINHPLDCPICDQGGECELQDLAMGYGKDVSRYQETKRVVRDKDIGPLIQTDLTRCIHCTRCVRFGEEIAGLRELGATGRGENMQIGTYVEKSLQSELSGNIIDLCPVGALTSKPFLFSARSWEMRQYPGIALHDCVGSNVEFHVRNNKVMRVVPAANEAINEVWLSDRDRFSYEGLYATDRLLQPRVKSDGQWQDVDWPQALETVRQGLDRVRQAEGADRIGALLSPSLSSEEYYLLQKLVRGIGSANIDHRLRQQDFSDPEADAAFPWLGQSLAELEQNDAILIISANTRQEVPLLNHRIRKAALKGGRVLVIDDREHAFNFDLDSRITCASGAMPHALAAVLKATREIQGETAAPNEGARLDAVVVEEHHRRMAQILCQAENAGLLLGEAVNAHPHRAVLRALALQLSAVSGARIGFLAEGANAAGAWLNGAVPHRQAFGAASGSPGKNVREMIEAGLSAYLLYHLDPELDCIDGAEVTQALKHAEFVVAFSAYRSEVLENTADVLLPIALFAENEGSSVNAEGRIQSFRQAVRPQHEIRPGWRALRLLGNLFELEGFDYRSIDDIQSEILPAMQAIAPAHAAATTAIRLPPAGQAVDGAARSRHMYAIDPLVRRGRALGEIRREAGA